MSSFSLTTYPYAYVDQFIPSLLTQLDWLEIQNYCSPNWIANAGHLVGKYPTSKIDIGLGDYDSGQCSPGVSSAGIASQVIQYLISNRITRISFWPSGGGSAVLSDPDPLYVDTIYGTKHYYDMCEYLRVHGSLLEAVPYMDGNYASNIDYYHGWPVINAVGCMAYTINNPTGALVQNISSFDPAAIASLAHSYGMKLVVLFTGGSANNGTDEGIANLLADTTFTGPAKALGDSLVSLANKYGFDEWQADLETEAFTNNTQGMANLLNYLASRLHSPVSKVGTVLSVSASIS